MLLNLRPLNSKSSTLSTRPLIDFLLYQNNHIIVANKVLLLLLTKSTFLQNLVIYFHPHKNPRLFNDIHNLKPVVQQIKFLLLSYLFWHVSYGPKSFNMNQAMVILFQYQRAYSWWLEPSIYFNCCINKKSVRNL